MYSPANSIYTTLSGDISTDTTINVFSSSGFPSGSFHVLLGTEILLVTNIVGTTWTVIRGQLKTLIVSHLSGSIIRCMLASTTPTMMIQDTLAYDRYDKMPTTAPDGMWYYCSDTPHRYHRENGAWKAYMTTGNSSGACEQADWTVVKAPTSITWGVPTKVELAANTTYLIAKPLPGSSYYIEYGYRAFAGYQANMINWFGVGVPDGAGTCYTLFAQWINGNQEQFGVFSYTSALANVATLFNQGSQTSRCLNGPIKRVRLIDNGSNRRFQYSPDGTNWYTFRTASTTWGVSNETHFIIAASIGNSDQGYRGNSVIYYTKSGVWPPIRYVPKGTRSVRVTMWFTRADGTYLDGYVDEMNFAINGGSNLIVNPSAASGTTGWTSSLGSLDGSLTYQTGGGFPSMTDPRPPGVVATDKYFGGGNNFRTIAYQDINVSSYSTSIDAGTATYTASAWIGGFSTNRDVASVIFDFYDVGGNMLDSLTFSDIANRWDRDDVTGFYLAN